MFQIHGRGSEVPSTEPNDHNATIGAALDFTGLW